MRAARARKAPGSIMKLLIRSGSARRSAVGSGGLQRTAQCGAAGDGGGRRTAQCGWAAPRGGARYYEIVDGVRRGHATAQCGGQFRAAAHGAVRHSAARRAAVGGARHSAARAHSGGAQERTVAQANRAVSES